MIPISRFVAVSLRPRVLGPDQDVAEDRQGAPRRDRATDDRQAAGEVLLHDRDVHERFTPGSGAGRAKGRIGSAGRSRARPLGSEHRARGAVVGRSIHILERHHHHHAVDGVDDVEWPCGRRLFTTAARRWTRRRRFGDGRGTGWWTIRRCDPRPAPEGRSCPRGAPAVVRTGPQRTALVHTGGRFSTESLPLSTRNGPIGASAHRPS